MLNNPLQQQVGRFSRQLKNTWQIVFLPGALLYVISVIHYMQSKPEFPAALQPYLRNIDLVSTLLAGILVFIILRLKWRYFSKRYTYRLVNKKLGTSAHADDSELLTAVLNSLRGKMLLVWLLGLALVVDGALFYWLTFLPGNLHIYAMTGFFSLLLNYPKAELFSDLAWYVIESRKEYQTAQKSSTST